MKNSEVVDIWWEGSGKAHTENLTPNLTGDRLFSYGTCIIQLHVRVNSGWYVVFNETWYSKTTQKHQYYVRMKLIKAYGPDYRDKIIVVDKVPKGTVDLTKYAQEKLNTTN